MNHKTIGIVAHVDAGKTTFAEQLLFHTKSISQRGRVDHKDAFLDSHEIEKARGITVFADQALMTYNDTLYNLIDTPGHVDFSPEMERSIQVMDYAIIIISAVEGVEGHTETVWNLLKKHHIPTFFFINKTDRVGADINRVLEEIRLNLTEDVCHIDASFHRGQMNEELIEFIAERNELLLENYMADGYEENQWLNEMRKMIKSNSLYPLATGSALQDIGITELLEKLHELTISDYKDDGLFAGRAYKIRYDNNGTRTTFIKALTGSLQVRDEIKYDVNDQTFNEKVTQIRKYNGKKFQIVDKVGAGELFAVTGLSAVAAGDGIGTLQDKSQYEMIPTLKSKVKFNPVALNVKDILKCFRMLDEEDPSLKVTWEESLQEIHIHVMGIIQLEVLEQLVKERFGFEVGFEKPEILYKETMNSVVYGYGHFEPLKHYAEVHLKLEPSERSSGIFFESVCHPDDLSTSYQNLIRHHLFEKEHRGLLTGSPLTDLKVTLLTGRAHIKHTSGGDFREATIRALRQGLEKAENILLEPYYDFKIKVDIEQMGRVLSDVQGAYGIFQTPDTIGNKAVISGKVPVATFMEYSTTLASYTQGKGSINLVFGGYHPCHNSNEVMKKVNYNKNADPEYTSSSIFCSKGSGYSVPWEEAESKMHL